MAPPITRNTGDKNPETLLTVPRILHIVLKENVRCAHTNIYEGAASMIFEKLKSLIAEQFNVDEDSITMETSFADDLNADSVDIDGHVYFTAAGLVPAGEFVKVRITGVSDGDLTGEIED